MRTVHTLSDLHDLRRQMGPCALVPTMGNLHAGHLSLIAKARESGLPVVASVFVNPLQFAPTDDFDRYPRTLERDAELLVEAGCDLLFAPSQEEFYPHPQRFVVQPDPELAAILEGKVRPDFFVGVCTVVMKLFSCVRPQVAVFGKKDYQQLLVLRRMAEQFALPIEVQAGQTQREPNGLALSSRNAYLRDGEKAQAVGLSRAIAALAQAWRERREPLAQLEKSAMEALTAAGWQPDYLTIRKRADLQSPTEQDSDDTPLVSLGAAALGKTRLIDNLEF